MSETPPAEPAPLNNLFACPTCNGWHFNISRGGTLVCTSRGNVGTVGCGWRGSLEHPPRQEGETPKVDDDMYVALADEVYLNAYAAPSVREELASNAHDAILKLLEERNAAERRAADAEAKVAELRKILSRTHYQINHPAQAGRVWVKYDRKQIDTVLNRIFTAISKPAAMSAPSAKGATP